MSNAAEKFLNWKKRQDMERDIHCCECNICAKDDMVKIWTIKRSSVCFDKQRQKLQPSENSQQEEKWKKHQTELNLSEMRKEANLLIHKAVFFFFFQFFSGFFPVILFMLIEIKQGWVMFHPVILKPLSLLQACRSSFHVILVRFMPVLLPALKAFNLIRSVLNIWKCQSKHIKL